MEQLLRSESYAAAVDRGLTQWGGTLLCLAIRWTVGWQFFKAGILKLQDWDSTLMLFREEYHVPLLPPAVAAALGTCGELAFPLLLFVGLASRPAAVGLLAVNAVAVLSYPQLWQFDCPAALKDHVYWGALLLVVVAFGPGRLALDGIWRGKRNGV